MSTLQLFALTDHGPQPLPVPASASDFIDLYGGLELGVYSVFRTFEHNKFLWLDQHLARTNQSMRLLGWEYAVDETGLRQALHQVCTAYPSAEMRVRIDVLAAPAHALGADSRVLIALMPFTPLPSSYYTNGVYVGFANGLSRKNASAKTADFAAMRKAYAVGTDDVYERLMLNDQGEILEGISSNFYGVRDTVLYTASTGVLAGVTRRILLLLAERLGIPFVEEAVKVETIDTLDEAAISSSSRGLLPVVKIAETTIGSGRPGPLCKRLMAAYDEFITQEVRRAVD